MKKFVLFLAFATTAAFSQEVKPLKVLMVCGGCCHDYANQKMILAEGISARANTEFTIVHEESRVKDDRTHQVSIYKNADWAKGYDVVIHNECFGAVTDVPFVEGIARPHFEGVPAVMLHCSTHSYRAAKTDEWRKCLGQTSMSHEKNRDFKVRNVAEDHPVMKGFPKEWNDPKDELYKSEKLWENFKPLATAYGEGPPRHLGERIRQGQGLWHHAGPRQPHHAGPCLPRPRHPRPAVGLRQARSRWQAAARLRIEAKINSLRILAGVSRTVRGNSETIRCARSSS